MISCIIVDDEHVAREGMKMLVKQVNFLQLKGAFASVIDADRFLQSNKADIMLLDIQMPDLGGMEYLKLKKNDTLVIFTTAHRDMAIDAFEFGAIDYLLKPIRIERFYKSVLKAMSIIDERKKLFPAPGKQKQTSENYFFVRHERKILRFEFKDILFIQALKDYCLLHTRDNKVAVAMNLSTIEKLLPAELFIRVNKSHIINTGYIRQIDADVISITGNSFTLSPFYRTAFFERVVDVRMLKKNKP